MTSTFETLCNIMVQPTGQLESSTKSEIESFFAHCKADMDADSEKLLATLFLKAYNQKINSEFIGENIYLGKYEVSQIQLFNILIEKFPFVRQSQQIVNDAILAAMQGATEVSIIDIGIGQGTQMLNIIEQARTLRGLKKLHFVGIEPYGEALLQAERHILACNGSVSFDITFAGIHDCAENVAFTSISGLVGKRIVNASLALHHIQSAQKRTEVLEQIKKIGPDALFLIEPNVNHYETDFFKRFKNCYRHFYSIFQVIDRIEDIEQKDKNALKLFFGREIEDIIGKEEKDRYEKHELATHWIERLQQVRFSLQNNLLSAPKESACGVEIAHHSEGFVGFTFKDETVLAIMHAN